MPSLQVGVPRTIATNLTVPERVNRYNIHRLTGLVDRGPYNYPGEWRWSLTPCRHPA